MLQAINNKLKSYWNHHEGVAAMEAAFVFPVLLVMLLGTLDMGRGIMSNQKTIKASQVVADLVTREAEISEADVFEAFDAGELSLLPYNPDQLGFDVISYRFLDDGTPEEVWRRTVNMDPIADPIPRITPLADPGRGVVIVVAEYLYEPIFAGFVVDQIEMQEVAFARGRRSEVVCMPGATGCG